MNGELRILLVGRICGEDFEWHIAPLPMVEPPTVEELQRAADEAEMTVQYVESLLDEEFMRRGGA